MDRRKNEEEPIMQYKYCNNENFEDYASGRVLYSAEGVANFPVRLVNEIFGYAKEYSVKKAGLCIYDPCCGGGYSLTVLGFMNSESIDKICGSDIDEKVLEVAGKNLTLLSKEGLEKRCAEIQSLYDMYGKASHADALESGLKLKNMMKKDIATELYIADCTEELPPISPDIIITDVPYGNLVDWNTESNHPLLDMLQQLADISHKDTVLAISMDKKQKAEHPAWERRKKQIIGKRKFEIYTLRE